MSLKPVFTARSRTDAILIRNMMRDAGIEAVLRTDDANGNLPSLDLTEGVDVLVEESQTGEAMELLEEYRKGGASIDEDENV